MAAFLSVLSSLLVGLVLAVIPWTAYWDTNQLLQPHPILRLLFLNGFARGAVSGLGLVNILLALVEARDHVRDEGSGV
jgi:hypothetical protein